MKVLLACFCVALTCFAAAGARAQDLGTSGFGALLEGSLIDLVLSTGGATACELRPGFLKLVETVERGAVADGDLRQPQTDGDPPLPREYPGFCGLSLIRWTQRAILAGYPFPEDLLKRDAPKHAESKRPERRIPKLQGVLDELLEDPQHTDILLARLGVPSGDVRRHAIRWLALQEYIRWLLAWHLEGLARCAYKELVGDSENYKNRFPGQCATTLMAFDAYYRPLTAAGTPFMRGPFQPDLDYDFLYLKHNRTVAVASWPKDSRRGRTLDSTESRLTILFEYLVEVGHCIMPNKVYANAWQDRVPAKDVAKTNGVRRNYLIYGYSEYGETAGGDIVEMIITAFSLLGLHAGFNLGVGDNGELRAAQNLKNLREPDLSTTEAVSYRPPSRDAWLDALRMFVAVGRERAAPGSGISAISGYSYEIGSLPGKAKTDTTQRLSHIFAGYVCLSLARMHAARRGAPADDDQVKLFEECDKLLDDAGCGLLLLSGQPCGGMDPLRVADWENTRSPWRADSLASLVDSTNVLPGSPLFCALLVQLTIGDPGQFWRSDNSRKWLQDYRARSLAILNNSQKADWQHAFELLFWSAPFGSL